MSAPDVVASEPSLEEAFGELADALVADEDGGAGEAAAPTQPSTGPAAAGGAPQAVPPDHMLQPDDTQSNLQTQASTQQSTQQNTANQAPEQPSTQSETDKPPELQPLGYSVNGQTKTFDGGYVVPGQGAVITNEALPKLLDRLQQADHLHELNQQLYRQVQEIQKLGGRDAFGQLTAQRAMLDASATLMIKAMNDPKVLAQLATDPVARAQMFKELQLVAKETEINATNQFREQITREQAATQNQADVQATVRDVIGRMAPQYTGLLPDDVEVIQQQAARMLPAIFRPATPEEARIANPPVQPGQTILDLNLLHQMLNDRHVLRQAVVEQSRQRQIVATDNAARASAAAPTTVQNGNGARPAPRSGNGKPAATEKKPLDQMSAKDFNRAMKSGRIWDLVGEDE